MVMEGGVLRKGEVRVRQSRKEVCENSRAETMSTRRLWKEASVLLRRSRHWMHGWGAASPASSDVARS